MSRWPVALFAVMIAIVVASPARADFSLVRWPSGDCKIWDNSPGNPPLQPGTLLVRKIPTYGQAWAALNKAVAKRRCLKTW
jgi:hypothetical protein